MSETRSYQWGPRPSCDIAGCPEHGNAHRTCDYGSCYKVPVHDGEHRCRCGGLVDAPANGCEWHTPGPAPTLFDTPAAELRDA